MLVSVADVFLLLETVAAGVSSRSPVSVPRMEVVPWFSIGLLLLGVTPHSVLLVVVLLVSAAVPMPMAVLVPAAVEAPAV